MNNGLCDKSCPPLMNDGRHVTDYRPSCYVHDLMLKQNGIKNSYDLKLFLQQNALHLQQINRDFYNCKNGCHNCDGYYLPDPNNQIDHWNAYSQRIGYGNKMKFCDKSKQNKKKLPN